jgi:GPH family glycoside/pentoside/hexuronide:cation symporter
MACIVGAGGFAEWLLAFSLNTLVMPVFTTSFGMSAALVGWAITIPRLVDAFTDPLIGDWSDRTRTRWGRRRPWIFGGGVAAAVLFVLLWQASPTWSQGAQFAWLLALSVLMWIAYGCLSVALNALAFEITDDYHERTRISTITTTFKILPQLVSGWIYWLALRPVFGGEVTGMRWVSGGIALLVVAAVAVPAWCARERFAHRAAKPVALRAAMAQAFACRPFAHLLVTRVLITLASYVFTGMLFYVVAYHVCGGDKGFATKLLGYYATAQTLISLGVLPFAPRVGRALGKRTLLLLGTGLHLATSLAAWVLLTPGQPWLLILLALLFAPAGLFMGVFTGSAMPDICDLDELQHGSRREGLFSAVTAFVTKVEVSLCALVIGYMLTFARFDAALPAQTPATLMRLHWLAVWPYALLSAAALALAFSYPLTAARMAEVRAQLAARRAE